MRRKKGEGRKEKEEREWKKQEGRNKKEEEMRRQK